MKLFGRTAIITGASGVVGGGIAALLGAKGCRCVCHYRQNRQRAEAVVGEIISAGGEAVLVQADVCHPDEIGRLFEVEGYSDVSILVNSAGLFERASVCEIAAADVERVLGVNLVGPMLVSAEFARRLSAEAQPAGKIVNLADVGGIRPWAEYAGYCASKAGLIGATKAMAKELAPRICVNAVAPGLVSWPVGADRGEYERQLKMIPAGRVGQAWEIARAVAFLLEEDYITGQVLNVDGGRCI